MAEKPHVLILSGFLGSGKTTLLVRLAEHLHATRAGGNTQSEGAASGAPAAAPTASASAPGTPAGEDYKIAIIENEIGAASVDTGVIQEAGYSVTEMLSGCVCCTLIGQLVPAIQKLVQELGPDLVILEATGVATPDSMRRNIEEYGGCPTRVVTLVDVSRWQRIRIALRNLLVAQLEAADVIVMSKTDLATSEQLAEIQGEVKEINATAPIVFMSATSPIDACDLDLITGGVS